jgi:ADP-ribose pyrophosphatase
MKKWQTLKSELIIDNQWCRVRQETVCLPNGRAIDDYFINIRDDIALILPVTLKKEVVFVRQYRHGVKEILLELPAGAFNTETEDSKTAAMRELLEETGYASTEVYELGSIYDNPVKDTNKIHLFLANNVHKVSEQKLDETEEIEVIVIPFDEVLPKVFSGEIAVAGSIAAIFLGWKWLQEN